MHHFAGISRSWIGIIGSALPKCPCWELKAKSLQLMLEQPAIAVDCPNWHRTF